MARFCSLFSSSKGNCTYVGTSGSGILIDAGFSAKQIENALSQKDISIKDIKGIFVTHEHTDHVSALRVLCERHKIPVFANKLTLGALEKKGILTSKVTFYEADNFVEIDEMKITSFSTSHDSVDSSGYVVELCDGRKVAICTDLGCMNNEVFSAIKGSDLVLLESNHDIQMLNNGPYPYILKKRILSEKGHLSNVVAAETACKLINTGTSRLVLGHLSKENNTPKIAFSTNYNSLTSFGAKIGIDYTLDVATDLNPLIKF